VVKRLDVLRAVKASYSYAMKLCPNVNGGFENSPSHEAALEERVRQLEQMVGKLTLENE